MVLLLLASSMALLLLSKIQMPSAVHYQSTINKKNNAVKAIPSMSWNKTRINPSPQRKTYLSPFGKSSDDEEDGGRAAAVKPRAPTLASTISVGFSWKAAIIPM